MIDDPSGDAAKTDAVDASADAPPPAKIENGISVPNQPRDSSGPNDGGHNSERPSKRFFQRLTVSEWLTFLVGCGSLVVAYLTYLNAADTRDIKLGVKGLAELAHQASVQAAETKRQADELHTQFAQVKRQADAAEGQLKFLGEQVAEAKAQTKAIAEQTDAAHANADAAQQQLSVMQDAQRAWIKISPRIAGDVEYFMDIGTIGVPFNYSLENVGHRPAFHITVQTWLVPITRDIQKTLTDKCNALKAPVDAQTGASRVLFPGENIDDWNKRPFDHAIYYADATRTDLTRNSDPGGRFQIWVIGCVAYDFGNTSQRHHTGFIYRLGHYPIGPTAGAQSLTSSFFWGERVTGDRLELDTGWPVNAVMD